jgi:hypothetical protein
MGEPWYREGLRFECRRCGACCRGDPGYVWVTGAEIERMARALGMLEKEFARAYVRRVGLRRSLKELPGGDCVLWGGRERGCLVYAARPVQCRTFPFWAEHVRSPAAWERLAESCPGVNRGRRYSLKEIQARLRERA